MRLEGKVWREGRRWLAEVDLLDAMTQGRTKKEALRMVADLVETLVNRVGFSAGVHGGRGGYIEISGEPLAPLVSLVLRRQREKSGLTLDQVAERMGQKSRNAYARYEQGAAVPSIEKLGQLLRAAGSGREFLVKESPLPHEA
jgi:predicted transcriptional regulator